MRESLNTRPVYLLLLTVMESEEDIVEGLRAGADDYVTKPFLIEELQARIQVGVRMVQLQLALNDRVKELEKALARIRRLEGLLPICSYCKRICDDQRNWHQIEMYVAEHSEAEFSHVICPECNEKIAKPEIEQLRAGEGQTHFIEEITASEKNSLTTLTLPKLLQICQEATSR